MTITERAYTSTSQKTYGLGTDTSPDDAVDQRYRYDARTYVPLSRDGRHTLAFWAFGDLVTGGVAPYLDLPATGMDTFSRSGRGYPQGRFRGEELLYGELE